MKKKAFAFYHGEHSYDAFYRTKNGKMWCFGYNGYGELGNGSQVGVGRPIEVKWSKPNPKSITTIVHGWGFVLLQTKKEVWGIGRNDQGQLGGGNGNVLLPRKISFPQTKVRISQIVAGYSHSIFIGKNVMYGTGQNSNGQLGIGNYTNQNTLTLVRFPKKERVLSCSAGFYFTIWLCKSKKLLKTGKVNSENRINVPTFVKLNDIKRPDYVVQVASGYQHCLLLTKKGRVYSAGLNLDGQLGTNNFIDSRNFIHVKELDGKEIVRLNCGFYSSYAQSKGKSFSWGQNSYGQLGLDTTRAVGVPQEITTVKDIVQIESGGYHLFLLTKKGDFHFCGDGSSNQLGNGGVGQTTMAKSDVITNLAKLKGSTIGIFWDEENEFEEDGDRKKVDSELEKRVNFLMKNLPRGNVVLSFDNGERETKIEVFKSMLLSSNQRVKMASSGCEETIHGIFKVPKDVVVRVNLEEAYLLYYGKNIVKVNPGHFFDYYIFFKMLNMDAQRYLIIKRLNGIENLGLLLFLYKKVYEAYEKEHEYLINIHKSKSKKIVKLNMEYNENDLSLGNYLNLDNETPISPKKDNDSFLSNEDMYIKEEVTNSIHEQCKTGFALELLNIFKDREDEIHNLKKLYKAFQREGVLVRIKKHIPIPLKLHSEFNTIYNKKERIAWKNLHFEFLKELKELWNKRLFCNTTIQSGDYKLKENVHFEVLVLRMNFFKKVMEKERGKSVVVLKGISCNVLEELLNYVYLNIVTSKDVDVLLQLNSIASIHGEKILIKKISKKLMMVTEMLIRDTSFQSFMKKYGEYFQNEESTKYLIDFWEDVVDDMTKNEIYDEIERNRFYVGFHQLEKKICQMEMMVEKIKSKLNENEK